MPQQELSDGDATPGQDLRFHCRDPHTPSTHRTQEGTHAPSQQLFGASVYRWRRKESDSGNRNDARSARTSAELQRGLLLSSRSSLTTSLTTANGTSGVTSTSPIVLGKTKCTAPSRTFLSC